MSESMVAKRLPGLKRENPRVATLDSLGANISSKGDPDSPEFKAAKEKLVNATNEYLKIFVAPDEEKRCICCDKLLGGLLGTFEYGLAHGEGKCSECGYPARANHYVEIPDLGEMSFVNILQYHPDQLKPRGA